jgi:hypothetical protein
MNGKQGDHPLTDILGYKIEVYGAETDDLIRKIARLCSQRELDTWWEREVHWSQDRDLVLRKARACYEELLKRARESGWEKDDA